MKNLTAFLISACVKFRLL